MLFDSPGLVCQNPAGESVECSTGSKGSRKRKEERKERKERKREKVTSSRIFHTILLQWQINAPQVISIPEKRIPP